LVFLVNCLDVLPEVLSAGCSESLAIRSRLRGSVNDETDLKDFCVSRVILAPVILISEVAVPSHKPVLLFFVAEVAIHHIAVSPIHSVHELLVSVSLLILNRFLGTNYLAFSDVEINPVLNDDVVV